jgi:argininosuccinate lyase
MAKLWDKGYELDKTVELFTVGDDYKLDMELVRWDCLGSIAHACMLARIGVLADAEYEALRARLSELLRQHARGEFRILREEEDVHTAVENDLCRALGDLGKKLHTARSRNDQVILDLRLYMRDKLLATAAHACDLARALLEFAERNENVPVVGRTHSQPAMPASMGLWAAALAESLLDDVELLRAAYRLVDQCPLGSAASFGVNLNIDRQLVSDLLGFARVQNNVLYANNSRGKIEAALLAALAQIMLDISKLSSDVIFWSMPEIGCLKLPQDLCAGSSLMPHKRNPDIFELARAKAATVTACLMQVMEQSRALISGYHRDFQETKRPLMTGVEQTNAALIVCALAVGKLTCDEARCAAAFTRDVFATDRVLDLVKSGVPFRDAYQQVAASLESTAMEDPRENIRKKTHIGATGNLGLKLVHRRLDEERAWIDKAHAAWRGPLDKLIAP